MREITERSQLYKHITRLLVVLAWVWLAGCVEQQEVREPVPAQAVVEKPVLESLAVRWRKTVVKSEDSAWLLDQISDKQVRNQVKKSLKRHVDANRAVKRLQSARWRTSQAQEITKTEFNLIGSGASLNTSWENKFWKLFSTELKNKSSKSELTDQDLASLRDSLVAQTAKAIYYANSLAALAVAADEQLVMLQQIQGRKQTGYTLGRQDEQSVRRAEEDLLKANHQREQLTRARAHAIAAIEILAGNNALSRSIATDAGVRLPPKGLSSTLVSNRPDMGHAISALEDSFEQPALNSVVVLPDFPLTGAGGRSAKAMNKQLSGSNRKSLQSGKGMLAKGLTPTSDHQQKLLGGLGRQFVVALEETHNQLHLSRQFLNETQKRKKASSAARGQVKEVRGKFNAGRTDLTSVLRAQIPALEAEGVLNYSRQIQYAQRMDIYMALSGLTR